MSIDCITQRDHEKWPRYGSGRAFDTSLFNNRRGLLSPAEERQLGSMIQGQGDVKARNELVSRNVRLIFRLARHYFDMSGGRIPFEDLFQEGAQGLVTAADKFDPSKGFRFSTFAVPWIRQAIRRYAVATHKMIKVPEAVQKHARDVAAAQEMLGKDGVPSAENPELLARVLPIPSATIRMCQETLRGVTSLDQSAGNRTEGSARVIGDLCSAGDASPIEGAIQGAVNQELRRLCLFALNTQEREIIALRYGLSGDDPMSLRETGRALNISPTRVAEVARRAMKKLQKAAMGSVLEEML